jgi:hypothetical protein
MELTLDNSKLSSAHVYLRQPEGEPHGEWDKLPPALVNDAAQLVKANSIEGEHGSNQLSHLTGFCSMRAATLTERLQVTRGITSR